MGYTAGQCTWGAAKVATWIPDTLGNAANWVANASKARLSTGTTPQIDAAMVFNGNYPGSEGDGHVGIVVAMGSNGYPIILEMNANRDGGGNGVYDTYQTTSKDVAYLAGYIYPPNAAASATTASNLKNLVTGNNKGSNAIDWVSGGVAAITGQAAGDATSALGAWVAPVLNFVTKGGEVLLGAVVVMVGLFIIAKQTGIEGAVVNAAGDVTDHIPGVGGKISKAATKGKSSPAPKQAPAPKAEPARQPEGRRLTPSESREAVRKAGFNSKGV